MQLLNFPDYSFNIKTINGKHYIFDTLRQKYVTLQPEELVRQNMIKFLIEEKGYNKLYMANEVSLTINAMALRADTLIYANNGEPLMIIEYKAPTIEITQKVFDQIFTYNSILNVNYLLVSNGLQHICCKINNNKSYKILKAIPQYQQIVKTH